MAKKNKIDKDTGVGLRERMDHRLAEPHHYSVIMLNDDFTPMDFVVNVLKLVFHKTEKEATELMLTVHKGGQATVGRYTYDIAVSKRARALQMAKEQGYPFRVELKEE
ncbi:MAG: ATP-dependent Clp protease adaptor ClpS [Lachnospiraceae bacterium]|nr:ATP-dependent Clp protease adaptor ClpS [Lachnospiraceae bacterium]